MKRVVILILSVILAISIISCGKRSVFPIGITDVVTEAGFTYADEEISPIGNRITVTSPNELGDVEFVLKPVEVKEENAYEPVLIERGKSVTIAVEKGAWFKVGLRMINAKESGKVPPIQIKGITVRIASEGDIADTAYNLSAIITEINGTEMLLDGPKGCFSVPMQKLESSPEPQVGDILEVTYDGRIEELYPSLFPGIISLKVYKPVEMTAVITDFGKYNDLDALYFNPVEFSSLNNCIVTDWKECITTGPDFEIGDEIVITYSGADDGNPAVLHNVVKIDLSHDCYIKKYGDKSKTEIDKTVDNYVPLPPYVYSGNDGIEKAITKYFEDNNCLMKLDESVWIPAFCVFKEETVADPIEAEAKKGDIKAYGNFWSFVYSKQGDTLFCESGGEFPGVVYLKKNDDESYEVTYFDRVGDGSRYSEDIKRICRGNTTLEKQFYESADAKSTTVKNIRTWNIYTYVKDNNLAIKYYQDYGWDPVDFNMEVNSWGNVILEAY